jgi:hypothetical protein
MKITIRMLMLVIRMLIKIILSKVNGLIKNFQEQRTSKFFNGKYGNYNFKNDFVYLIF